jgi:hypothetical protein
VSSPSLTASGHTVASGAGFWNVAIDSLLLSPFTTAWWSAFLNLPLLRYYTNTKHIQLQQCRG